MSDMVQDIGSNPTSPSPDRGTVGVATGLRIFNTLTRQVEEIAPLEPGHIRMYTCGPTVYRYIHVGNLRSFVMADWIRRSLIARGYTVTHVKNITDVGHMRQDALDRGEDKVVAQALKEGKSPEQIAQFYTEAFMSDEVALNILPADIFPRATEHVVDMIAMTQRLIERGYAYEAQGNVFFSVRAFPDYGKLSGNLLEHLGAGQHTATELESLKRTPEDFPLWKAAEPGRMMAWDSPWGRGFPGWHIECSAMSAKYLGEQFDIHTGGVDNIFPHHEDERAQSEAASGKPFVSYWVHGQHLLADGLKMAKSSGNAYTRSDVEGRGYEPLALRYFYTTAKYRTRINFSFRAVRQSQIALNRLRGRAFALDDAANGEIAPASAIQNHPYRAQFFAAINDDLNMPRAMATVWMMLKDASVPPEERLALLVDLDFVLGFQIEQAIAEHRERRRERDTALAYGEPVIETPGHEDAPEHVLALARERIEVRAESDWMTADTLRDRIEDAGFGVRDMRTGVQLYRLSEDKEYISSSSDVPSRLERPDRYAFSVNLIAHNNREDLERCVNSIVRSAGNRDIEIVIVDNASTDDTLPYVQRLRHDGVVGRVPVRMIFADHDMGFAAARNASFRASLGRIVILMDTSIEVKGDIWTPIERELARPDIGLVGPYGLITHDLREFEESAGPDVDAVEGYLMAFPRNLLLEVGPADEKFRFYRLMDIDYSFEFKKTGYRVVVVPRIAERVIKHPHREWYSLAPDEQATKSKKNYDIFRRRRHHAQSLLAVNYKPGQPAPWGHDHELPEDEVDPRFEHSPLHGDEPHTHEHKHWPDHSHTHAHTHTRAPRWFKPDEEAVYVPGTPE